MRPQREPFVVAAALDIPGTPGLSDAFVAGLQLGLDEAVQTGHCDRPVEVQVHEVIGHPWSSGLPVTRLFEDIAAGPALAVAGPMASDNALSALPVIEAAGLPTISIAGTEGFTGRYTFRLSNGSLSDEPWVMASWLVAQGIRTVGVFLERPSRVADEYLRHFRHAAHEVGLVIIRETGASPVADQAEVTAAFADLHDVHPDGVAYLGFGSLFRQLRPALESLAWDPVRVMTAAFIGATYTRRFSEMLDGWVGIDQYDERNKRLQHAVAMLAERGDVAIPNSSTSTGYDIGSALGRALGRMAPSTRDGLRDALETVRRLPAATGSPGTTVGFGPSQHFGFSGPDYLVLRRAESGATTWVGTGPIDN